MIYLKGHLARPLDAVLTAPSRLAVLRALYIKHNNNHPIH